MKTDNVKAPVGLECATREIERICSHSLLYRRCGLNPAHYIINLDAGNGQTTLTEFIAAAFSNYGIRHFGGLDAYLEYKLDGSMTQLKQVFRDIRACAVYTNEYEGVVAFDVAGLCPYINEAQIDCFLDGIAEIGGHATMIFYIPAAPARNVTQLTDKIRHVLDHVETLDIEPYTREDIARIIERMIRDLGIVLKEPEAVRLALLHAVAKLNIKTVKDAAGLTRKIITFAGNDHFTPVLEAAQIELIFNKLDESKKEMR